MMGAETQTAAAEVAAVIHNFEESFPRDGTSWPFTWRRAPSRGGRSIIVMPGAGGTTEFFAFVAHTLRDGGLDPVFVDYAGDVPPDELAALLQALVCDLDLSEPVLLGCSYSAYWSQHLSDEGTFSRLILCNGFVEATDLQPNPLFDHAKISAADPETLQGEWRVRSQGQAGTRLGQLLLHAMSGGLPAKDLRGRLLEVSSARAVRSGWVGPVSVIDCDDDQLVRDHARKKFRDAWPGARHVKLNGGGHYPYVLVPEAFALAVLEACNAAER
jgi:pimeloyl-ACP methyl ester carboxylesterase